MKMLASIKCSIPLVHKNQGRDALVMTTTLHKASEYKIDALVHELYGLTEEDIGIIEVT